jgi:hypothetical protein
MYTIEEYLKDIQLAITIVNNLKFMCNKKEGFMQMYRVNQLLTDKYHRWIFIYKTGE